MKPGQSLATITVLPSPSPKARAMSKVSSLVSTVRTISRSGITGTGLKK